MLAELAVVEPDDQAQLGVETAGGQGGPDVGLVVAVDEGQRGGVGHARLGQRLLVEFRCLQDAWRRNAVVGRGGHRAVHDRLHPREQGGRPRPSGGTGALCGDAHEGHDDRDPFAVDGAQFGGEPLGECVTTAHDHVAGLGGLLRLAGQGGHGNSQVDRSAGTHIGP